MDVSIASSHPQATAQATHFASPVPECGTRLCTDVQCRIRLSPTALEHQLLRSYADASISLVAPGSRLMDGICLGFGFQNAEFRPISRFYGSFMDFYGPSKPPPGRTDAKFCVHTTGGGAAGGVARQGRDPARAAPARNEARKPGGGTMRSAFGGGITKARKARRAAPGAAGSEGCDACGGRPWMDSEEEGLLAAGRTGETLFRQHCCAERA